MQSPVTDQKSKLTNLQVEFLKSLRYMATEKQLADVRSLLRFYFAQQLDAAIEKWEQEKNYTAAVYEEWGKMKASPNKPAQGE